ncbi:MAG: cupin domain-containing protein [Ferruginibacter sp.]
MPAASTGNVVGSLFIESASIEWEQMGEGVKRKIMAYDEHVMLVRVEFEKGGIGSLHNHPQIQLTNVESGVFDIEIDGMKKTLKAGDAFYVPSNCIHGVVCLEAGVLIDVFNPIRKDFLEKQ